MRGAVLLMTGLLTTAGVAAAAPLSLDRTTIVVDSHGMAGTERIAADLLAADLASVGAAKPAIVVSGTDTIAACRGTCIVIGRYDAPAVAALARAGGVDLSMLAGAWERYVRAVVRTGNGNVLLIAGSDRRGAVYGVTDLSRAIGVSPWSWWADVTPRRRAHVDIDDATIVSRAPSVRYRGIFLNDEDWGLQPWAAKTFDPAKGNIGPRTYARVFELMWRLKANTLWPAMHSVSTPFYADPGNAPLADRYAIVVGTSHAEPMMRNNLREWDESVRGAFDFTRRSQAIVDYWAKRVAATRGQEDIYTLGLRGLHDGPMQGAGSTAERQAILERVFAQQQSLLARTLNRPISDIPQVFVAYHELQEAYDAGLKVPGDVTLMWTDDNYGWLRRVTGDAERRRPGGSGVYYHLSYWGRPHDYLWLGTTHPELIREEMGRAWDSDARRMWIVNVGDIKPIEYLTQYFLDLAFDDRLFATDPQAHLTRFMAEQFGAADAGEIADIMMRSYDLAWERKPEFMGFGETEWVTPNQPSGYVQADGEEAEARIAAYRDLAARAEAVAARMPADRRDAFFELVLYPVRGAAGLNTQILSLDLAALHARQRRGGANVDVDRAHAARARLVADTAAYNALAGGKWRGMMDLAPRRLPVFEEPLWPRWSIGTERGCRTAAWGQWIGDENALTFTAGQPGTRTVTLYGQRAGEAAWRMEAASSGLSLGATSGVLTAAGAYAQRLTVAYDGRGAGGTLTLRCDGAPVTIHVATQPAMTGAGPGIAVERDRRVTLGAMATAERGGWQAIAGLGSLGGSLRAPLDLAAGQRIAPARWRFATRTAGDAVVRIVGLPTHPVTSDRALRIAVRIDDGAAVTLDLATRGRSDQWRANVLTNTAVATVPLAGLAPGGHQMTIAPLDPGVMIDRIEVQFDRARPLYGADR
ncbi:hypothetical protein GGQ80_000966 [Sphingomonas jinjuensis]|uniref:Gylcosyl hydrolase 115 C-terminal domain-containing protein n=1 Tax=Sphingomonas jinjuensis TaxID=535907 RepID=A0A840FGF8_9SPHN|nr:glycosyl hydrolase 115 family protein [Sphingomonas jinjuensis]MBB4153078.1 hypothetical protein [Sphingomonas jinjuensis]